MDLLIAELNKRLEDKQLRCTVTPAAKAQIIEGGYDPMYGARPLRRYVQRSVETLIGKAILADDVLPGSVLEVDAQDGALTVHILPPQAMQKA